MGLFSNNKKLCPICGAPTPRLFPTKVEGLPICKECDAKIELPDGALDQMDLEQFKAYMDFYEKNGELRSLFTETDKYDFGYMGGCMVVDTAHGLFKRRNDENAIVMESKNLKSFRILEDENVLFESKNGMLVCHKSDIPKRANDLSPLVTQFQMRLQEYEWREEEERRRARAADRKHLRKEATGREQSLCAVRLLMRRSCLEISILSFSMSILIGPVREEQWMHLRSTAPTLAWTVICRNIIRQQINCIIWLPA